MLKVKLKKELESLNKKDILNSEMFVSEVKQLMEGTAQKERDILKEIGLGHNIIESEKQTEALIGFKSLEKEFDGEVYTISQIKYLALKYNLKFLPTKLFQGAVAPELGAVLVRFKEKHNLSEWDVKQKFYILAPEKMFKLVPKPIDPLLFYRVEDRRFNEPVYKLVHKWGNDFTIARRISGILNGSDLAITIKKLVKLIAIFASIHLIIELICYVFNIPTFCNNNKFTSALFSIVLCANLIVFAVSLFVFAYYWLEGDFQGESSRDKWTNNYF